MQPEDMIPPTLFEGKMPTTGASLGSMSAKLNA